VIGYGSNVIKGGRKIQLGRKAEEKAEVKIEALREEKIVVIYLKLPRALSPV
jgi:hypothetical protein